MTTVVTELYYARLDAGASTDKARRAAEAPANYDDRFNRLERQIAGRQHKIGDKIAGLDHKIEDKTARLDRKIDDRFSSLDHKIDRVKSDLELQIGGVKSDVSLLKWMLGAVLAFLIPLFMKQFIH